MDPNPGTENIGFTSSPPQVGVKKKNSKLWIIIVLAVILAVGGYFIYSNSKKKEETKPVEVISPTEAPTAEPTQEASPSGTITPSPSPRPTTGVVSSAHDLSIQVLNGSGTVGAAGDVKSYLAGKGYKNLDTGNADNFDYTNVTVKIKSSQSKFLSAIQDDLSAKYTLATGSGSLSANSDFDVAVIVGK